MKKQHVIIGALLIAACSADSAPQQGESLAASELTYFSKQSGWTHSLTIDPWLAPRPELVRSIRAGYVAATSDGQGDCGSAANCSNSSDFKVLHDGRALVSLINEENIDGGGAHPVTTASDYLYDTAAQKRIRFGDIFLSWSKARSQIQSLFCENLRQIRDQLQECPDVQKQAIALVSFPLNGPVSAFLVQTQDYALGSYADGRESVRIEISQPLLALIRQEYRRDFDESKAMTETASGEVPGAGNFAREASENVMDESENVIEVADSVAASSPNGDPRSSWDTQPFAVATSSLGQLYLSHARCPVSWMEGRARLFQPSGVIWEMCWRTDKKLPSLINVCNVSPALTRKDEVGACMPASKSKFVDVSSLPQSAF